MSHCTSNQFGYEVHRFLSVARDRLWLLSKPSATFVSGFEATSTADQYEVDHVAALVFDLEAELDILDLSEDLG